MKQFVAIILAMCLLLACGATAETPVFQDSSFAQAVKELNAILAKPMENTYDIHDVQGEFNLLKANDANGFSFYLYSSVLASLKDGDLGSALSSVNLLAMDSSAGTFQKLLTSAAFTSRYPAIHPVAELKSYVQGRQREASGAQEAALECYRSCATFYDSFDRSLNIQSAAAQAETVPDVQQTEVTGQGDPFADETDEVPEPDYGAPSIGKYQGGYRVEVSSHYTNRSSSALLTGDMTVDGNLKTAWNTNRRISGEWIQLSVTDGKRYAIGGFRIANGYWKSDKVFITNTRPKTLDVYCDGTYVMTANLTDEKDFQTFRFPQPVIAGTFRLLIQDGYTEGIDYKDTAITEIELLGPACGAFTSANVQDWGNSVKRFQQYVAYGSALSKGSTGMEVLGLQVVLRDAFGVLTGYVDNEFGSYTMNAINTLQAQMSAALGNQAESMTSGVADRAFWNNMLAYADQLGGISGNTSQTSASAQAGGSDSGSAGDGLDDTATTDASGQVVYE